METQLITICCPITKCAEIFKMASKMAAENRKLNVSDCMADKTEIPSAQHTFLWSRNTMETNLITTCCPLKNLQRYSRWRPRLQPKTEN